VSVDLDIVADREDSVPKGFRLALADVEFGVVLSDKEPAAYHARVAQD